MPKPIKKKPTPKTIKYVLFWDTEENSLSFFDHRPDGSKYLVKTGITSDFVVGLMEEHGESWRDVFKKKRLENPDLGISIMISPPLATPLQPDTPDGPSYA